MGHPEQVEIKLTVGAAGVDAARERLDLTDDAARHAAIWFCDRVEGRGEDRALELFEQGLIVRLRRNAEGDSDTTVKLRRPEPLALPPGWGHPDDHHEVEVEGDWTGESHQVSASVDSTVRGRAITRAVDHAPPLDEALFSKDQRSFAEAVVGAKRGLRALQPLGPVLARRWRSIERPGLDRKLSCEQWVADDLLFLELSIRAKFDAAERWQERFTEWADDLDLGIARTATTKTKAVLDHFISRLDP